MGLLIVGDIHCGNKRPFSTITEEGLNSRFADTLQVLKDISDIALSREVDGIICFGDIFDTHGETLPKDVLLWTKNAISRLVDASSGDLIILSGNHDLYQNRSLLTIFEDMPGIHVVDTPQWVYAYGWNCMMIPYARDIRRTRNALKYLEEESPGGKEDQLLFTHIEIQGLTVGKNNYHLPTGIKRSEFPDIFKYKFAGHIHSVKDLDDVICVGSVVQTRADEEGDKKRVILIDDMGNLERIPLNGPRFKTCVVTGNGIDIIKDEMKENNDYYTIILKNPVPEHQLPTGHRVKIVRDYRTEREERLPSKHTDSHDKLLVKYLDKLDTKLDKKELTKSVLKTWVKTNDNSS